MIKKNIIISPSQQKNKCLCCQSEKDHCRKIANEIYKFICQDNRFNVILCPDFSDHDDYLERVVNFSNKYYLPNNNSIHIDIHSDAYRGNSFGHSCFYYSKKSFGFVLATQIYNNLSEISRWKPRALYFRPELEVLNKTKSPACLIECFFHDEIEQAKFIHDNIKQIASSICCGIYEAFNINSIDENNDLFVAIYTLYKHNIITDLNYWKSRKFDNDFRYIIKEFAKNLNS